MVRKISILIFVSLLSISNSTIALELLNDLDESSSCEFCVTEINFSEGGCIISSGEVKINFVGDGAIDFGEDGYLDLGDGGSIAGYDGTTSSMSAAGSIVLGENGRIVGGGIYAEEGFSIKLIDESSLVFYDGEDYLDECAKNYEEVVSSKLVDSCEEQVNDSGSKIALISDNNLYLGSGVNLDAANLYIGSGDSSGTVVDSSGVVLTSVYGNISIVGAERADGLYEISSGARATGHICGNHDISIGNDNSGEIKINVDDAPELVEQSDDPQTENSGGGAISLYILLILALIRSKSLFGKM